MFTKHVCMMKVEDAVRAEIMEGYEIVHRLGLGACGAVYLARSKETKRLVALKKIELDERKKTRTKEAVLKEASILSQLKHPHIVSYHESFFDEEEEFLFIVQDYCDGGTLEDKIREAAKWFTQLTMAVQHMHSNKILHRDLKTENVFMTKKNVVKIGDFGISKVLDSTIDMAKTVVGTPTYLSPELCQDIPYSSKSDIWALGCVLYEMCALKPPFDAQNLVSLFFKIIKAEYQNIMDASAILNMPFVKKHLAAFIEEKENLLHSKVKDSSNRSSPHFNQSDSNMRSPGTPLVGNASHNQHNISPNIRRKQGTPQHRVDRSPQPKADKSPQQIDSGLAISEDIPEDIAVVVEADDDYADDFEEYDSSEDLDEMVTQAKEAVEIEVVDDYIVDERISECQKQHTGLFKRPQIRRTLHNEETTEVCHFDISELPTG
ncbi:hypothetical protein KUTeg_022929 [Tegillarca granosa]|uniref:non-specific serine/threonine protein kinase n=1 Tax=Tegillarca granosa TaxID=220873 RepID=A0ABQ9E0M2_TEGGR|nr:hypothetical protein KUTeg_022929 [Tegillarca granosa]